MSDDPNNTRVRRFEGLKEKLKAPGSNIPEAVAQIKEFLEKFAGSTPEQPNYFSSIIPDLLEVMRSISPKFSNCPENTARLNILEIILKCPNFEIIRNYYIHLFKATEEIMAIDNEDNASLAIKLFVELTKSYKEMVVEQTIGKFLKFAENMFKKSEDIGKLAIERASKNELVPSQESFKVLIECGSAITSLYHHYQRMVPIKEFITYAFEIFIRDDPKDITRNHKVYNEYILCKTKTFSFLAQFAQSEQINRDLRVSNDKLPIMVLKMIKSIPSDFYNIKKDLFQGFSLIIKSTTHKPFFARHIDSFMEESEISGNSSSIRAAWFTCMLDFIENFKSEMSADQLCKAIGLVCKNMHHFPIVQGQSLNTIKSLIDNIRVIKDKPSRSTSINTIDSMYTIIITALSKRLSYFKNYMEEICVQARENRIGNIRNNVNISEPNAHFKKITDIVKTVIYEKHYYGGQVPANTWDQSTVKMISKILKNMIITARIYPEYRLEREEQAIYENITNILSNINDYSGSQHIFFDIFQTLLPFLFLCSIENAALYKIFESLGRHFKENYKVIGDVILPFIIENLEIMEQDSALAEAKIISLHHKAKLSISTIVDKHLFKKRLGKRLGDLLEMMLVPEVLEVHGKRLIQKCEELCKDEPIPKYVMIAKNCAKVVFNNKTIRNELSTAWLQQQDPLLLPNPPYYLIYQALCSSTSEKISQACTLLDENFNNFAVTPEITKRLFELMHKPQSYTQKEVLRIISKLSNNIRNCRQAISVKAWNAPPNILGEDDSYAYAFTFSLMYDPSCPPIQLPLDYVINKINNSFKGKTAVDENQKKTVFAASRIISISVLHLLSKLKIDTKLVVAKVSSGFFSNKEIYIPNKSRIPALHCQSFAQTLRNAIEVLISLLAFPETVDDLSELYETVFIHMGFLMFSSLEGEYTDIGFNTIDILDILCEKLAYLEKDNDKRFKASLKGLNTIITTISKILHRNDTYLYKSETIKQIMLALIRTCYRQDWTMQFGACGGLYRLLKGFPHQTVKDFSVQLMKTSLHVLQSFSSISKSQLSEEIIQLFKAVYEYCDKAKVVAELAQGLSSQSSNLRFISRKLLVEHGLIPELFNLSTPVFTDKNSNKPISDQLKDLIFSQSLKYALICTRTMILEAFNFCVQHKILTFESNKAEIISFMKNVFRYCIDDTSKEVDPKRVMEDTPEKVLSEKISAFECMKTILDEEDLWTLLSHDDEEAKEQRYEITFKFLRAMSHHSDLHIISIVKSGIENLLRREETSRHILPQDQLKVCLRPILMDLAKANNLPSLQLIQNFSRLLEVISDCFNVNLGNRLITHLNKIEPQNKELLPLIPAIANLFYLMPKCTEEILTSIIQGFCKAEENLQKNQLQGYINSYFSLPLIRYLARFPVKTMEHFFKEKKNMKYFINLISHPMGYPLRDIAARDFDKYLKPLLESLDPKEVFDGVKMINSLVKYMPKWISTKPDTVKTLQKIYHEGDANVAESELIEKSYLHKHILKCFISFIRYEHKLGIRLVLLDLPIAYGKKNVWNLEFLTRFLKKEFASLLNLNEKRRVLKFIMKFLHDPQQHNEKKNKVLEFLMLPFINECFKDPHKSQIIKKSLHISTIRLIRKHLSEYANPCCVHLMSLGSMLIENFEHDFFHYRKELIKFYWGMIKSDNPFIKGSAYVNVARFIGVYSLPDSLTVQLLGALFKAHNQEIVHSAHQAFTYLSAKLITFFQEARFREYLTEYVKKYLFQETRQFQSMIHVIDIIIKNSSVFYHIRDGLLSHFLNWINHLGLGLHSNYNAKKTLLDLTAVMIDFSEQHFRDTGESYINPSHKEMLINFFARFGQAPALYISRNPQRSFEQMNVLSIKCIANMKNALRLWQEVNFKAKNWTEALKKCVNLVQQHQQRNNAADALKKLLDRSLQIIKILSEYNTRTAIIQYPELVKYLALQVKSTDSPLIVRTLCDIVATLLEHPADDLRKQLNEILENSFINDNSLNCYWTIKLLSVVIVPFPSDITLHMKGLLILTTNLIKDLSIEAINRETKVETIQNSLKILQNSISHLSDENKKVLKGILSMIFESIDVKLITDACKVLENWIQNDEEDPQFLVKDQCVILMKVFASFKLDIKHSALPLELAVRILNTQTDCYEPRILLCKSVLQYLLKDPSNEYKLQFNQILKDLIGISLWRRLLFIFDQAESGESKIWAKSSLDIILGGLEDSIILENESMDEDIDSSLDKNTAELLRQHFKYINKYSTKYAKELIHPLRQLLNFPISNMLFTNIFPQIWTSLTASQQNSLVFSIENALLHKLPPEPSDTNSAKSVLVALSSCVPLPYIRPEILQYLAKAHNAWNICMPLLETYVKNLPEPSKSIMFLEKLHKRLSENEMSIGYKMKRCVTSQCKAGLESELFNSWEQSKYQFTEIMEQGVEDAEISREAWNECLEKLGDWKTLIHFSEQRQDLSLVDFYWQDKRTREFSALVSKLNISNHPQCVYYKIVESLENKVSDDFSVLKESEQELETTLNLGSIISEWSAVPKHPATAHNPLMQLLDLRSEVSDGLVLAKILDEQIKNSRVSDKNDVIEKWKNKIVSTQDGLKFWGTALRSRKAILEICKKSIEKASQNLPIDINTENIYIDLTYAKLLRKTGAFADAANVLEKTNARDKPTENYLKSREEVQLHIAEGDFDAALGLANFYAQSDSFTKEANSEFRRFKGKIYAKKGELATAIKCFKNSFQGNPRNLHTLLDLGKVMAQVYPNPKPSEATEIMGCFLLGIQHRIGKYKSYIPRILNLLEVCDNAEKFIFYSDKIAPYCTPWLYQILKKHDKSSGKVFEVIVKYFIENNPQQLYHALRNFITTKEVPIERLLSKNLLQIYIELKKLHSILVQNLENLCDSLVTHIKPTIEEELFSIFSNLLYTPTAVSLEEYKLVFETVLQKVFLGKDHDEFIDKYYEDFRLTFSEYNMKSIETVVKNIKKWKDRLASEIKQFETQYIDQECGELSNFYSREIEIPIAAENIVILERIIPKIMTLKNKNCNKVVTFKGSNYKDYDFTVSFQCTNNSYNIFQLTTSLQHFFQINTYKINHRIRGSNFEQQLVLPLGNRYYLMELKPKIISLKDVYEIMINEESQDPEYWLDQDCHYEAPCNLFSSYAQRILQSPNRYSVFRKQFTAQWALMYVFCTIFHVPLGELQLSKVWVSLKSGTISFSMLDVPLFEHSQGEFRITPNIFEVIGQAAIDGVMPAIIVNAFKILSNEVLQVFNLLKLVLDDKRIELDDLVRVIEINCNYQYVVDRLEKAKSATTDSLGWMPWF